jgi:uncharacterized protein YjbI with pentapeptide repeats
MGCRPSGDQDLGCHTYAPNLTEANLSSSELIRIKLGDAILTGTNLTGANLTNTHLTGADFTGTNLTEANLSGANLGRDRFIPYGANLRNANLKGAKGWTNEQLAQAISLIGATLPDGTVIKTEEESEEFKKRYRQ